VEARRAECGEERKGLNRFGDLIVQIVLDDTP
jgi:hypothetical protein